MSDTPARPAAASRPGIEFFSAVLIVSAQAERLARFYRDVLGIPLEEEQHDEEALHWGCTLGDLHFAIHPLEDFAADDPAVGVGAVKLAFAVFDLDATIARLREHGVEPLYPPRELPWTRMTAVRDPDGNFLELTELGADWYKHLEARRRDGHDIIARFRATRRPAALTTRPG